MQTMEILSWTVYKALLASKMLVIQYGESSTWYELYAPEAQTFIWHISLEKGTADATDFETNYKSAANAPMTIGGGTIQAHIIGETQIFTSEAIRDTAAHNSSTGQNSGFRVKTIIVSNGLNQDVSLQCQGSRDGSTWFNVGTPWPVTAATSTYQTCETYFPFLRAVATCAVAPASGSISMWLERMGS